MNGAHIFTMAGPEKARSALKIIRPQFGGSPKPEVEILCLVIKIVELMVLFPTMFCARFHIDFQVLYVLGRTKEQYVFMYKHKTSKEIAYILLGEKKIIVDREKKTYVIL